MNERLLNAGRRVFGALETLRQRIEPVSARVLGPTVANARAAKEAINYELEADELLNLERTARAQRIVRVAVAVATGVFVRVPIELLQQQPDMARMVEIVTSLKAGRSMHDLIEMDKQNRRSWAPPEIEKSRAVQSGDGWVELAERGQKLFGDFLALAGDAVSGIIRK